MKRKHQKAKPEDLVRPDDPAWKQFRMPAHFFDGFGDRDAAKTGSGEDMHECTPIVAFVNSGSGGHVGEKLAQFLRTALGPAQVYEVGKSCNPEAVLKKLWANLDSAAADGDKDAAKYRSSMRLLAAGGDGSIAWVLNSVRKLGLEPCPPAAVIPLGTGNGLSINFGWGKTIRPEWIMSNDKLLKELKGIAEAELRAIDIWHVQFQAPNKQMYDKDDIPPALSISDDAESASHNGRHAVLHQTKALGVRPGCHPFVDTDYHLARKCVSIRKLYTLWNIFTGPEAVIKNTSVIVIAHRPKSTAIMAGEFCYYFTFGLDAEAAHRFDHLRKSTPWLTKKRKMNIFWYMWFIVRTGWFCGASPLNEKIAKLQVKDKNGSWIDVKVADSIRALIIINLQTYSGGRDVWGLKDERATEGKDKGFVSPIFDDGLLEVVGLEGGCTSWAALSGFWKNLHGKRIAQANELRIVYHSPKENKGVAMRMDGEPWWQALPDRAGEELKVHIKREGQAQMLLNTNFLPGVTKKMLAIAEREKKLSCPSDPQ